MQGLRWLSLLDRTSLSSFGRCFLTIPSCFVPGRGPSPHLSHSSLIRLQLPATNTTHLWPLGGCSKPCIFLAPALVEAWPPSGHSPLLDTRPSCTALQKPERVVWLEKQARPRVRQSQAQNPLCKVLAPQVTAVTLVKWIQHLLPHTVVLWQMTSNSKSHEHRLLCS